MVLYDDDLFGKRFMVIGEVEEHLKLGGEAWVKLRFRDGSTHLINLKYAKEVKDTND